MMHRLVPAGLFAIAAALYWVATFAVLGVVVPVRLSSFRLTTNDGCGGECTVYVSLTEVSVLIGMSAAAAAFVAVLIGPRLAARHADRSEFVWRASAWITSGAYALAFVGVLLADGLPIGWQMPLLLVVFSPFLLTALPFGMGAAHVWHRLTQRADLG